MYDCVSVTADLSLSMCTSKEVMDAYHFGPSFQANLSYHMGSHDLVIKSILMGERRSHVMYMVSSGDELTYFLEGKLTTIENSTSHHTRHRQPEDYQTLPVKCQIAYRAGFRLKLRCDWLQWHQASVSVRACSRRKYPSGLDRDLRLTRLATTPT
jgi:hypothetical protein